MSNRPDRTGRPATRSRQLNSSQLGPGVVAILTSQGVGDFSIVAEVSKQQSGFRVEVSGNRLRLRSQPGISKAFVHGIGLRLPWYPTCGFSGSNQ